MSVRDKNILVAVSGGIAAFKAVELVRELGRRGARVKVALTPNAARFVGPVTFTGLTGEPALLDLWDASYPGELHVVLAEWAHAIVVAPATANLLARAAHGMADDLVLATLACADCPVLLAPAMHERMWLRPATQRNIELLQRDGVRTVGPTVGKLANGKTGQGRMAEPSEIAQALDQMLSARSDLAGNTVVISAGPTLEDLDPVRFISNRSSGKMGYAIATAARNRGATVVLVTGPTHIAPPADVEVVQVRSALEMQGAIEATLPRADIVIMTAAVADYRAAKTEPHKLKKKRDTDTLQIELVKNPDILAELGARRASTKSKRPVLVGFAMETQNIAAYGRSKLTSKRVDMIVANEASVAFGGDQNQATFITHSGDEALAQMPKLELADQILDRVRALLEATAAAAAADKVTKNRPDRRLPAPKPARPLKGRSRSKA
ncbi:MAG TPA: bifunctional phosphopantothenoylcysteine decarboxylase/phosphopantothenate--cysteine ligase CoaBC [Polyangiales bacterium]|nr:bifunctional phosphopantothenoylcysteine decarboxylase/phosphopantothenate--cysteine ligase CoaBC [Polyangiales bacterium]